MRVQSLGSGSSGNALLVEGGGSRLLIDAGLPPRTLVARLCRAGVDPRRLDAILLTHEHYDHIQGAADLAQEFGVPIVADERTLRAALPLDAMGSITTDALPVGRERRIGQMDVYAFPVSHDAVAPCGYLVTCHGWRVCVAIDCGMVHGAMLEALLLGQLIVLEANHDRQRLLDGPYSWALKQRILSPTGHLSNDQAADAIIAVLDGAVHWIWLAHLSRTNNLPDLAARAVMLKLRHYGAAHLTPQVLPPGMHDAWDTARLWDSWRANC
jgi:phosphoribosyl 1,2-cyclic phosphodiesterase